MIETPQQRINFRRRALLISAAAMVIVYILWNVEQLNFIVYPLRLFVTYVHEAGHSLAAIITGGRVIGFLVSPNGSGLATTAGGTSAFIIPAGYLGAAFFGSMLFYLANRFPRLGEILAIALGVFIVVFTLLFARPDEGGALTGMVIGVLFGGALMFVGWKASNTITLLVLNVLALMTALNAVLDVWSLVSYSGGARGSVVNDAAAFSREVMPILPTAVVAFIWSGIAVLMMALAVYYGLIKPLNREINDTLEVLQTRTNR